jgi:hypothetical protein
MSPYDDPHVSAGEIADYLSNSQPMAILNYTTQIDAGKTVAELTQLLVKAGCQKVLVDYDANQPATVERFRAGIANYFSFTKISVETDP